MIHGIQRSLQE